MNRFFASIALLLLAPCAKAQSDFDQIIESEKKSFMHLHKRERSGATNNNNVTYQRLELQADPAVNYIAGKVTTCFIPLAPATFIEYDLSDTLRTDSVLFHNTLLPFVHSGNIIHINFPSQLPANQVDSIAVFYQGAPTNTGFGSFDQGLHDSVPIIWTLSEPYGAKDWWPCKQDLQDKIDSLDVIVTTPSAYRVASNGLLVEVDSSGGNTTYHWKHRYPIATYLVCMAVSNYAVYYNYVPFGADTLSVLNYVYPEHLADAQNGTAMVVPFMQLYDTLFGEYPFSNEKYGHCEFGWGGGMEHQTFTFVTGFGFEIISHELAHHWFGDKVTCSTWGDIWLNEGFATYLTALCYEHVTPQAPWYKIYISQKMGAAEGEPHGSVWCDDTTSVGRIFNGHLSYSKGAMVLHMLRWTLGDSIFYSGLRDYLNDPQLAYSFAQTSDLKNHLETASGKDLNKFFTDWVYGKGYPTYQINWSQDFSNRVTLVVNQIQSDPSVSFFEMPLPIRFKNATHDTVLVFNHTFSGQTFTADIPFYADSLIFDPDMWLIHKDDSIFRQPAYDFSVLVFPNPLDNILQLRVETSVERNADIKIVNQLGQYVWSGSATLVQGPDILQIDVSALPSGQYHVALNATGKTISASFVKGK